MSIEEVDIQRPLLPLDCATCHTRPIPMFEGDDGVLDRSLWLYIAALQHDKRVKNCSSGPHGNNTAPSQTPEPSILARTRVKHYSL